MGFPRQGYWSWLPFSILEDLPDPGIQSTTVASPSLAGGFFTTTPPRKPYLRYTKKGQIITVIFNFSLKLSDI